MKLRLFAIEIINDNMDIKLSFDAILPTSRLVEWKDKLGEETEVNQNEKN